MSFKSLFSSQGLRQSVLVTSGNTLAAGLSAIALILLSRLLGPQEFGIFSIGFSVWQLVLRLSDGGINIAIQTHLAKSFETNQEKAANFVISGLRLRLFVSLTLITLGVLLTPKIAFSFLKTDQTPILYVAIVTSILTSGYEYISVLLQALHRFLSSVKINLIQSLAKVGAIFILWVLQIKNAVVGFTVYSIAIIPGVVAGLAYLPQWFKRGKVTESETAPLLRVARYSSIAIIAAAICDNADVLLVKRYLTEYDTGLFAAAARLTMLFSLFAYSLGTVLNSRVARYETRENFLKYARKSVIFITLTLLSLIIIIPTSGFLLWITAGSAYLPATATSQYLIASGVIVVATTPLFAMFYALDRPQYFALGGILQALVLVVGSMVLIPLWGINGAGIAKLASRLVVFVFSIVYALISIKKQFRQII